MLLINGKEFLIYELDTQKSFINRLAAYYNTLPKYLYFPNGIPDIYTQDNIIVEDLLQIIKEDGKEDIDFEQLYYSIYPKLSQSNLDIKTDILIPFISYNKFIELHTETFTEIFLGQLSNKITQLKIFANVKNIWKNRFQYKKSLDEKIENNKKTVKKQVNIFSNFDKVVGIPYTEFELEKTTFFMELDILEMTILEIFNTIKLNEYIPFATVQNFYKILKDFIPSEDWVISFDYGINLKIMEKNIISVKNKYENYSDIIITVEDDGTINSIMSLSTFKKNVSKDIMIDRFLSVFDKNQIYIKNIKEKDVSGILYFPNQTMNKYVLSDLIMNNPLFNQLSIDDSTAATKRKSELYIHFIMPKIGHISATLTEKSDTIKGKSNDLFTENQYYIRIKIKKAANIKVVKEFMKIFSKLFAIYNIDYPHIVNFYRQFIPDFAPKKSISLVKKSKESLKEMVPELFISNYTKYCPQFPTIIDDDQAKEAEKQGKQVMIFPKAEDTEIIEQNNYICNYPEHIYPGLKENRQKNKDQFPYVPCCYIKNQKDIIGSKYRQYYEGENIPKKELKQQGLITSNKIVQPNIFGTLPQNITKMFDIFEPNSFYTYVRMGVYRTENSFLNCVLQALNVDDVLLTLNDLDEVDAYLLSIRDTFSSPDLIASCKQEMYDFTNEEIIEYINNPNKYLDPKLFIHLLEVKYNCNIFIFSRKNINGELIIPRHIKGYYTTRIEKKCVFIFEHSGSSIDQATYPQCELIVRWKTSGTNTVQNFSYDDEVSVGVRQIFNEKQKAYILDKELVETILPLNNNDVNLISQSIDSYGKTRVLKFEYMKKVITLLTTPIQPLKVEEDKNTITQVDLKVALDFASKLNIIITKQLLENNLVYEIIGILGNVSVIIPVNPSNKINNIPEIIGKTTYPKKEISLLNTYNQNKKMARYIIDTLFWVFSKYLYDQKISEITQITIKNFVKKYINIDSNFKYGNVSKTFSFQSGIFHNNKIVVGSEEILKRLIFILRKEIIQNRKKILEYHNENTIKDYYLDLTDFEYYSFQIILQGDKSVIKWIREKNKHHQLYNTILLNVKIPYFFHNKLINNSTVYLAQNTDSIEKAKKIAIFWYIYKYNDPYEADQIVDESFKYTIYSYVSKYKIKPYTIFGKNNPYNIQIIGYKNEDESLFTTLLKL